MPSESTAAKNFSCFCYHVVMWDLDKEILCHEWVGSWLVMNMWWYERGGSYPDALVWGSSYVSCSHLRVVASGEVHSWWITYVGLWAGRSVELDYEWGGSYRQDHKRACSWKHYISWVHSQLFVWLEGWKALRY